MERIHTLIDLKSAEGLNHLLSSVTDRGILWIHNAKPLEALFVSFILDLHSFGYWEIYLFFQRIMMIDIGSCLATN